MEVHSKWVAQFRGSENTPFYDMAFDYLARHFGPPSAEQLVDAGCGTGTKSLHLARRGYRVLGLDISETIVSQARKNTADAGFGATTEFRTADLTDIKLPSGSVKGAVCWGVLMHVPAVEKAIAELSRIVAPGGTLAISEGNKRSIQSSSIRLLKGLLRKERAEVQRTPAGIEFWEHTSTGRFMTRQADVPWFIREFEKHGMRLVERRAGQFTELYAVVPWKPLRKLIHAFNHLWFRLRWAGPSYGNLLVFRKAAD
jgi:ubiquinone/menaquinone biosynthesis C-methylase UbiE